MDTSYYSPDMDVQKRSKRHRTSVIDSGFLLPNKNECMRHQEYPIIWTFFSIITTLLWKIYYIVYHCVAFKYATKTWFKYFSIRFIVFTCCATKTFRHENSCYIKEFYLLYQVQPDVSGL